MELTRLLAMCRTGSPEALDDLVARVYAQLRRAAAQVVREDRDATMQPTVLVHEAYMEMVAKPDRNWVDRQQFMAIAAGLMRRILLRHAQRRRRCWRGGVERPVTLVEVEGSRRVHDLDIVELDRVLNKLKKRDPFKHRVVEQRIFAGLGLAEIADLERVTEEQVRRAWSFSKVWIRKEMQPS